MDHCVIATYGTLLLAVIFTWFGLGQGLKMKPWYFLFPFSTVAAYACSFINLYSVLYTAIFGFTCYQYLKTKNRWLALPVIVLACPLFLHAGMLGFNNYRFLDHVKFTDDAVPYSLYFNFDKTLICIFMLGFSSCSFGKEQIIDTGRQIATYLLILAPIILGLTYSLGYVRFEPKLPDSAPVWMLVNLFFVCTSEELLFRGILQKELEKNLKIKHGPIIAIATGALLFGLAHFNGGPFYILFATICGFFYGHIYYRTKEIRSSILLHFSINLVHFLLFTYPAIEK